MVVKLLNLARADVCACKMADATLASLLESSSMGHLSDVTAGETLAGLEATLAVSRAPGYNVSRP